MAQIPNVFRRFIPQLLHMIILPVFFFVFSLVYKPHDLINLIGEQNYGVHLVLISCIVLMAVIIIRLMHYFIPMKMNYTLYIFWCLGEIIFVSFFVAMYLCLALHDHTPYFEILTESCQLLFMIMIIPYSILALSLRVWDYHERSLYSKETDEYCRMRFYDDKHNLKIVLTPDSIIYIAAEENYVNIFYMENSKLRKYVLRSTMKSIEELCMDNGLIRCHRSYFVNPVHVKVLRKEHEGVVYAELDAPDVQHIPVSKRYYDRLSELL